MTYIKVAVRKKIEDLDDFVRGTDLPEKWDNFVNDKKEYLIFKNKKDYHCNYCEYTFRSDKKINEYEKCPSCKKESLIKTHSIQNYQIKKDLILVQKYIDDKKIIRTFELLSWLNKETRKMEHSIIEWHRSVVDLLSTDHADNYLSNCAKNNMGNLSIAHYEKVEKWRPNKYLISGNNEYVYYHNLNKLFNFEYYDLNNLFKNVRNADLEYILKGALLKKRSLELLIKAKLYNLAKHYENYEEKGTFLTVFGVDKSYISFMQKNNINHHELRILKVIKMKNIELIRYLGKFEYYLPNLMRYCKPMDLFNYKLNHNNAGIYADYLRFAEELGYDLTDKKYLYPKNLKRKHDELMVRVEILENEKITKEIQRRYIELSKNKYQNNEYLIMPSKNVTELKEEGKKLNHCVATYAEKYAEGKTDIYFLRKIEHQNIPFVTVEVKKNKIVQNRTKNNELPGKKELNFLKEWENNILNKS